MSVFIWHVLTIGEKNKHFLSNCPERFPFSPCVQKSDVVRSVIGFPTHVRSIFNLLRLRSCASRVFLAYSVHGHFQNRPLQRRAASVGAQTRPRRVMLSSAVQCFGSISSSRRFCAVAEKTASADCSIRYASSRSDLPHTSIVTLNHERRSF